MKYAKEGFEMIANEGKGKVLGGKEGSVCEVIVGGWQLEHVSEFKYFGFAYDESGTIVGNW